jgi:hypothetical protein
MPQNTRTSGNGYVTTAIVVFVLAILASVFGPIPGWYYMARNAKQLQSKRAMRGLEIAIRGHQTEYLPSITLNEFWKSEKEAIPSEGEILKVLMAENERLNPHGIRFYEPPALRKKSSKQGGTIFNEKGEIRVVDHLGNPFWLLLDLDGDGAIPNPNPDEVADMEIINAPVILYSSGDDGDPNTWRDNLKSWDN